MFFISCQRASTDFDVVIVGGGASGLAAQYFCQDLKVLLLEKDSVLGGRVKTFKNFGVYYDVGADYVLHNSLISKLNIEDSILEADSQMAYLVDGVLYTGNSPFDCIKKMPWINKDQLEDLFNQKRFYSNSIDTNIYNLLNKNIKSVFPASLREYNLPMSEFAWMRYNSSHFLKGNQVVIDKLKSTNNTKYILNASVFNVLDKGDNVEVSYYNNRNEENKVQAKKVIVTTPSAVASQIIKKQSEECSQFLSSIKYASYQVITYIVDKNIDENKLAYILPMGTPFSNIVFHKTDNLNRKIIQFYIADEDLYETSKLPDVYLYAEELLNKIWLIDNNNILFKEKYFWPNAGPIVDSLFLEKWSNEVTHPSTNVYLAGDYTWMEGVSHFGMVPAIQSGKFAVTRVKKDLSGE